MGHSWAKGSIVSNRARPTAVWGWTLQMLGHWSYVNTELQERHNVGFQGWSWAQTEHMFEGFSIGQDRGQKGGYPKNTVPQDVWLKGTQRGTRVSMACGGRSAACVYAHTSGRWVGGRHEANGVSHIPSPEQRGLPQGIWKCRMPRTQVPWTSLLEVATPAAHAGILV